MHAYICLRFHMKEKGTIYTTRISASLSRLSSIYTQNYFKDNTIKSVWSPKLKLHFFLTCHVPFTITLKHWIHLKQILISQRILLEFSMDSYFNVSPLINISKMGETVITNEPGFGSQWTSIRRTSKF